MTDFALTPEHYNCCEGIAELSDQHHSIFELQIWDGREYQVERTCDNLEHLKLRPTWLGVKAWCAAFAVNAKTRSWRIVRRDKEHKPYRRPRPYRGSSFPLVIQAEVYADWLVNKYGKKNVPNIHMWETRVRQGNAFDARVQLAKALRKRGVKCITFKPVQQDRDQ